MDEHEDKEKREFQLHFLHFSARILVALDTPPIFFERPSMLFSEFAAILNFQVTEQKAL